VLANGHVYVTQKTAGHVKELPKNSQEQQQVVRLPRNADIPGPISPMSNREMHYPNFQGQQMLSSAGKQRVVSSGWLSVAGGTHNLSLGIYA